MKEVAALRRGVKKYIDTADEQTIKMIHAMLEVEQESDWWDELDPEAQKSIERGLKDADAGKVTPHETVMKKYRKFNNNITDKNNESYSYDVFEPKYFGSN